MPALRIQIDEKQAQREINRQVKTWLWRYRYAKLDVARLEGEYRELIATQESAGAINYDGMPSGSGNIADLSNLTVQRENSLTRLNKAIRYMSTVREEITDVIDQLTYEKERAVLSLRYIQLRDKYDIRDMSEIASLLGCSESRAKTLHSLGLQNLYPILMEGQYFKIPFSTS